MHKLLKIPAVLISAAILIATSGCGEDESSGMDYAFNYGLCANPENLDPQLAEDEASLTIIQNTFEGLVGYDENGILQYAGADTCEISEDGLSYKFILKNDRYWYDGVHDKVAVTAYDYVFAFQRIFNPVTCSPYRETFSFLKNADEIINGSMDYTKIGVSAEDSLTIVFELDYAEPCFLELLTTSPAMPCNQEFFEGTKARYGLDEQSVISNGPFYIKQWFYDPYGKDNFIFLRRNTANMSESYDVSPYSVNFIIEKSDTDMEKNFKTGKYDCIVSENPAEYRNIISRPYDISEYICCTLGIIINPEDDILSDENIRKALSLSVDRSLYKDKLVSSYQVAYGIIPPSIMAGNKNYRECTDEQIISEFNPAKAAELLRTGYDNLSIENAEGLTIMTCPDYADTVYINELINIWHDTLGISLHIEEVELSEYKRRIAERDYQMAVYEISGELNNPYSILRQFSSENNILGYCSDETDSMLREAAHITGTDKKCIAYAEIESDIIRNCGFIPFYYKKDYFISGNGSKNLLFNPFSKTVYFRYGKNFG